MKNAWIALIGFLAITTFFLWEEHQAHILGALPWALLLLCPILHLFMHRGHNGHGAQGGQEGGSTSQENPGMEKGQRGEK
ncbi:MAG: DUF2933 domain-containing protein [Candidatus Deferrimicrobiaceae bacterium]